MIELIGGGGAGGSGVIERERVRQTTEAGDHDRFAHYIWAEDPGAAITQALIEGTPLQALCGKVWVPSRDAKQFPVCPECQEIKDELRRRHDDGE